MKLEVTRKDLNEALTFAGLATKNNAPSPILQTLRLDADASSLSIVGCDMEMWAERKVVANVAVSGAVCVPTETIRQVVASLPDGTVSLELVEQNVFLRMGGSEWRMMALPAEEFPPIPDVEASSELRLAAKDFRDVVESVAFAVSTDNSRQVLTGVLFTYDGATLTLVATDTHRLAVNRLEREGIGSQISAVVPEKALRAVRALPLADDEELTVRFDQNRLAADAGTARVVSQLLDGVYPNWERVLPAEPTRVWTVDRSELMDHVKRAMILARDSANRVRFSGQEDKVRVDARSEEKGESHEFLSAVMKNGDIDIAFNGKYVEDALRAMKAEGVRVELNESMRPAVFRPMDDSVNQLCVIMPMALS